MHHSLFDWAFFRNLAFLLSVSTHMPCMHGHDIYCAYIIHSFVFLKSKFPPPHGMLRLGARSLFLTSNISSYNYSKENEVRLL